MWGRVCCSSSSYSRPLPVQPQCSSFGPVWFSSLPRSLGSPLSLLVTRLLWLLGYFGYLVLSSLFRGASVFPRSFSRGFVCVSSLHHQHGRIRVQVLCWRPCLGHNWWPSRGCLQTVRRCCAEQGDLRPRDREVSRVWLRYLRWRECHERCH